MVYFFLLIQVLISSGTYLVAKSVAADVEPMTLTLIRSTISALALVLILFARRRPVRIDRADYPRLIFLSLMAISCNQFLFMYGIKFTTAGNGALLYATTPAIVMILNALIIHERLTKLKIAGAAIAFIGATTIVFERGIDMRSDATYGNLMISIAVVAWALYTVYSRPMVIKYGALQMSALTMIGGNLLFLPVGLYGVSRFNFQILTAAHWSGFLYLGLATSVVAYFLWFYAIGRIETSKVAVFANAQPIMTGILSYVILDQSISAAFIIGTVLTIIGIMTAQVGK